MRTQGLGAGAISGLGFQFVWGSQSFQQSLKNGICLEAYRNCSGCLGCIPQIRTFGSFAYGVLDLGTDCKRHKVPHNGVLEMLAHCSLMFISSKHGAIKKRTREIQMSASTRFNLQCNWLGVRST